MNKFAKGSLAAGAGLVLLLGGAGTLAYWNDSADLTGGTINAGTLELTADEGTWAQGAEKIDATQWTMVPGDELTYTAELGLLAQGNNIRGTVVLDESFVSITPEAADQIDVSFDMPEGAALPDGVTYDDEVFTFTQPSGDAAVTIPVEVTVSFPFDEGAEQNSSQGAVVDLQKISFTATQTPDQTAVKN